MCVRCACLLVLTVRATMLPVRATMLPLFDGIVMRRVLVNARISMLSRMLHSTFKVFKAVDVAGEVELRCHVNAIKSIQMIVLNKGACVVLRRASILNQLHL